MVHEARSPIAVYVDLVQKLSIPRSKLPPGTYTAEVRVDNEMSDVAVGDLPRVTVPRAQAAFTISKQ